VPDLPGWPFLGQISEIWPCFDVVGLKIRLAFWLFFSLFTLKTFLLKENITIPFFRNTYANFL